MVFAEGSMIADYASRIIRARRGLLSGFPEIPRAEEAAEGGCGVLGFASNIPIAGRHVLTASRQMHNRGNGKGGGIAMVGLDPGQARVDAEALRSHYLLQIALIDPQYRQEIEKRFILPNFVVRQSYALDHIDDFRAIDGLAVCPPDVWRYFVRVKEGVLDQFAAQNDLADLDSRAIEDEFVYQNSFLLNREYYASLGVKRAFVLSHGRNLSVLKIVGYAEDVVAYYNLEDQAAHVWIAHQRYPTKGRVWHPGGAHPFIGLNEALVHNGDFANYHAVSEYLRQRNIGQLFLTDTEVSVQLFDLWDRVYGYPLEITLEAMAPTTEFDFEMLPADKQAVYRAVQRTHMHGSPDGPWFFIVARSKSDSESDNYELLGITDTSMLRPQVFALFENLDVEQPVQIGLIASERQAINACLRSLSSEDPRFQPLADRYWVARGGSHTDGGAFRFTVSAQTNSGEGKTSLSCANKFGLPVFLDRRKHHPRLAPDRQGIQNDLQQNYQRIALHSFDDGGPAAFWKWLRKEMPRVSWDDVGWIVDWLVDFSQIGDSEWEFSLHILTNLRDQRYDPGNKKRSSLLRIVDTGLERIFNLIPLLATGQEHPTDWQAIRDLPESTSVYRISRLTWETRQVLEGNQPSIYQSLQLEPEQEVIPVLILDATGFPAEGDQAAARWIVRAHELGWQRLIVYNWRGGRFAGVGLGPASDGFLLDLYGDVGDYTASGLDGGIITIHGDGQDQLGQIMKAGKLVIYGDAGQTFLYGAKGGDIYVQGSVAGRPLINAVGKPRAVINGTCLDYLAESFMAGDPLQGGGFVILNGVKFDDNGELVALETPYPGGNLFSLASGGAIYLRDPLRRVSEDQLNGGIFLPFTRADWDLILPYLIENERLFNICLEELLTVDGTLLSPSAIYRKIGVPENNGLLEE
jgi:glutamate synthase domain-containing protein 1